jgi:sarcosine oxidase
MNTDFEYIVLGLGGIGSGAAYWLSRRAGDQVLGLEQFELGHDRGGSQDHSRIIRLSYHTPGYVRLAGRAYEAWAEVERASGEQLIFRTGGVDLWPEGAAIPMDDYTGSLKAEGVPFEELDAAEVMRRWPQWRLDRGVRGLFQADAGIVAAAGANDTHQRLAREHGATLLEHTPVEAIHDSDGELQVFAGGTTYRCRRLILSAGAWSNDHLEHLGVRLPLTVTQEQVTYFASPRPEAFAPDRFPIWIWMDEPSFYGFPLFGEAGPKVGQDVGGQEVTADTRSFEPNAAATARVEGFLAGHLPDALGPPILEKTCLYTLTPDRDFVIDAVPGHPGAFAAVGAGHAFKFASLIGRTLADLAVDGATDVDLEAFRIDRPVLTRSNPPKSFLV